MEEICQAAGVIAAITGSFCAIAFCVGNLPAIPTVIFMFSFGIWYIYDAIEEHKDWKEKRRRNKAEKIGLISL